MCIPKVILCLSGRVAIVTEPETKIYRISFFKSRSLGDNTSVRLGINKRRVGEGRVIVPEHPWVMMILNSSVLSRV